ncbi:YeiH family protein [Chloroflexota bacterium]
MRDIGFFSKERAGELIPGLLVTLGLAVVAYVTWWLLKDTLLKFSALLWAFIFSIIVSNLLPVLSSEKFHHGIEMSSTRLLRWSIALLGLTFSAAVWANLGGIGIAAVLINLVFAFTFGFIFCRYVLKLDGSLTVLLSAGTSICGATAIAACGPAIRAKAEEMGLSLAVITLFGLVAMFGYPLLYYGPLASWLDNNPLAYGMWAGMGVHETAQVIVAGSQVEGAAAIAISAKFIRIFMIGPTVLVSLLVFRQFSSTSGAKQIKLSIPWFAIVFTIFTLVHLGLDSLSIRYWWSGFNINYLKPGVTFLLAWSFAAVGLKVKISAIRSIGLKAFIGGMVVAGVVGGSSLLLVKYLWMPFSG